MIVGEAEALAFIEGYKHLMLEVLGPEEAGDGRDIRTLLAAGRKRYLADPSRLERALEGLAGKSITVPPEVLAAVRSLEVKAWVYLRDTRAYSIFIDPDGQAAYGVLGLTQRLRDILGDSGAVVETGLMCYGGRYVTDALVTRVAWLGRGYRQEFTTRLGELRAQGKFCTRCPA
ncbi:hypothetical protein SAMN04244579_00145 [Azotobacter beijerinckii]|uniref:Uncharacterized protein n=1 Tax=Azotobacter beijerinckii TaxID=170623 RepID=A0A1H6Q3I2_9GAMM|nr:hypothetical protein [Azotobacter beijerinckii]SEI38383.1 hypothetical protein SAMN04244579_00145 [Azotobacter beijerinckii]